MKLKFVFILLLFTTSANAAGVFSAYVPPAITATATSHNINPGDTTLLSFFPTSRLTVNGWFVGCTPAGSSLGNSATLQVTPDTTTTYSIIVTDPRSGVKDTACVTISVRDTVTYTRVFVVSWGESGSSGMVLMDSLAGFDYDVKPGLQMLNTYNYTFGSLHEGTNNLLRHVGAADNSRNGWELELANIAASDPYFHDTIWGLKVGSGGNSISWWDDPVDCNGGCHTIPSISAINLMLKVRFDSAIYLLGSRSVFPVLFVSMGLNDYGNVSDTTMKRLLKQKITDIRSRIPLLANAPTYITLFNQPGYTGYNSAYSEIPNEMTNVFVLECLGCSQQDGLHYGKQGYYHLMHEMTEDIKSRHPDLN